MRYCAALAADPRLRRVLGRPSRTAPTLTRQRSPTGPVRLRGDPGGRPWILRELRLHRGRHHPGAQYRVLERQRGAPGDPGAHHGHGRLDQSEQREDLHRASGLQLQDRLRNGFIETDTGKFFNVKDGIHVADVGKFVIDWETGEIVFQSARHDIGLSSFRPFACALLA
jgi:hypothetical protein